jgi:hypothetical protein
MQSSFDETLTQVGCSTDLVYIKVPLSLIGVMKQLIAAVNHQ